jgi:hypothetical protein
MLAFLAIAVLGLLLAPFVVVQIQERVFRHRVEQLFAEVRSLMLHKATLADIRAALKRGDDLETEMGYPDFDVFATRWGWLRQRLFNLSGGRWMNVHSNDWVMYEVPRISFGIVTGVSAGYKQPCRTVLLEGAATYDKSFSFHHDWHGLTLHPNYVINETYLESNDWCGPVLEVYVSPKTASADIARLTTFDFSCVSRLVPCRNLGELMPEAAAQYEREEPQLEQARINHVCGPDIVGLMARDANFAGVVETVGVRIGDTIWERQVSIPTVRMVQDLEPASRWKVGESHDLDIFDVNTDRAMGDYPPLMHYPRKLPAEVRTGNRFIILAQSSPGNVLRAESCGVVPLNPANLELVKQAIAGNLPPAKP